MNSNNKDIVIRETYDLKSLDCNSLDGYTASDKQFSERIYGKISGDGKSVTIHAPHGKNNPNICGKQLAAIDILDFQHKIRDANSAVSVRVSGALIPLIVGMKGGIPDDPSFAPQVFRNHDMVGDVQIDNLALVQPAIENIKYGSLTGFQFKRNINVTGSQQLSNAHYTLCAFNDNPAPDTTNKHYKGFNLINNMSPIFNIAGESTSGMAFTSDIVGSTDSDIGSICSAINTAMQQVADEILERCKRVDGNCDIMNTPLGDGTIRKTNFRIVNAMNFQIEQKESGGPLEKVSFPEAFRLQRPRLYTTTDPLYITPAYMNALQFAGEGINYEWNGGYNTADPTGRGIRLRASRLLAQCNPKADGGIGYAENPYYILSSCISVNEDTGEVNLTAGGERIKTIMLLVPTFKVEIMDAESLGIPDKIIWFPHNWGGQDNSLVTSKSVFWEKDGRGNYTGNIDYGVTHRIEFPNNIQAFKSGEVTAYLSGAIRRTMHYPDRGGVMYMQWNDGCIHCTNGFSSSSASIPQITAVTGRHHALWLGPWVDASRSNTVEELKSLPAGNEGIFTDLFMKSYNVKSACSVLAVNKEGVSSKMKRYDFNGSSLVLYFTDSSSKDQDKAIDVRNRLKYNYNLHFSIGWRYV